MAALPDSILSLPRAGIRASPMPDGAVIGDTVPPIAMLAEAADFPALLQCLAGRLPALRAALLSQSEGSLQRVTASRGEVLLRQGDAAQALYVVAGGLLRANVTRADGSELTLSEFGPGELAGEMAVLAGGGTYSASVTVVADATLVRIPFGTFARVAEQAPEAIQELSEGIRRRILRDQLAVGLTRLFGDLQEDVLRYLEARVEWVRLRAGERLFAEGDSSRDLYFILGGRLLGTSRDGGILGEMGRGESIGEIALLTGEPRTATIEALRDSDLVRVSAASFDEIVAHYPQVMQVVARIVVKRLRTRESRPYGAAAKRSIAVFGIGSAMPMARFGERLVAGLARIGSTLHLSAQRVDAMLNQPGITAAEQEHAAGIRLTAWLDEQEATTQFLVYETDGRDSPWTRRCLRQADEILLVADATADPVPRAIESTLLGAKGVSKARQTLVLLHADGSRLPSKTARWFGGRNIRNHFHIRLDGDADFARMARCLAGVAIGLVFGGGGARGLAHIGVIRALGEAGVPIDMVGGTSMGAVIAGTFAMGLDWHRILELSRDGWLRRKPHKEYTLPLISIVRSRVLDHWVHEVYGETGIEDLWLGFYCVSCNLTRSEATVFERGSLAKAIRASASLPGVFVPVLVDGEVYVDGAIVNNLPGDIMRRRSCSAVIAVDVGSAQGFAFEMTAFPSPWQLLWSRLLPFARPLKVPNIATLLVRTTEVSSIQKTHEAKLDADLCLRPPIGSFGVLEFERIEQIVESGYRYTKERVEQLRGDKSLEAIFPPA